NAHAWCEVYDAGIAGWRRVDPTPDGDASGGAEEAVAGAAGERRIDRSWAARVDSLRVFWYRRIVNFDSRTQEEALRAVKSATQESGRRVRAALEEAVARLKAWLAQPWDARRVLEGLGTAAGLLVLVWAVWRLRFAIYRLRFPRRSGAVDPVRREAGRWLVRLQGLPADPAVRAELERLRYGPATGRPAVAQVFRRARTAWKAARRVRTIPGS
ncbi:MAG: DUF3488 domain-containing protein, partial [Opitutaceae bacterium]|nr:DUF3488 domain-containing protein [Opitutaceae bacterium]